VIGPVLVPASASRPTFAPATVWFWVGFTSEIESPAGPPTANCTSDGNAVFPALSVAFTRSRYLPTGGSVHTAP
jgi:hypothetical protein